MSRHTLPYEGATVMRRESGTIRSGPRAGQSVEATLHDGLASHGFRTDYQHVPKRWVLLRIRAEGRTVERRCWAYSGKRWPLADTDYEKIAKDIREECGTGQAAAESGAR